jgi:hypothetical protein
MTIKKFEVGTKVKINTSDQTNQDFWNLFGEIIKIDHLVNDCVYVKITPNQSRAYYITESKEYCFDHASERLDIVEPPKPELEAKHKEALKFIAEKKSWKVPYLQVEFLINEGYVNCMGNELTKIGFDKIGGK